MYEQLITIILVAVVLGADAFSLSMGMALKGVTRSYELKFAGTVGIFHVFMPLLGLSLGLAAGKFLGIWAARLGALVLIYIGIEMLIKGYHQTRQQNYKFQEGRSVLAGNNSLNNQGWSNILVLATMVSIDALTVGFSLGTVKMPLVVTVIITGSTAGIMTLLGFRGGRLIGRLAGYYAQICGGIVLVALAIKMVF